MSNREQAFELDEERWDGQFHVDGIGIRDENWLMEIDDDIYGLLTEDGTKPARLSNTKEKQ